MTPLLFVLILVFIATGAAILWVTTRRDVTPFLAVTMVLYFVNWLLAPIVMTILAWDRIINRLVLADLDVFTWYSIVEVGAYFVTVVAFGLTRHRFRFITSGRAANWQLSPRLEIFLGVVSMVGSLASRTLIIRAVGSTYSEGNNFALRADSIALAGVNILLLLDTFFTAYVITALVQTAKRPRIYVFALWSSIFITALQWTLFGQRMSMLAPPVILLYWIHQRRPSRTVLALGYAAIGLFVGTVGVIALLVIGQMRGRNELQFSRAAAESKNVVTDKSRGGPLYDAYDQVQIKFDGISMGAFLVEYFGSGTAGFRPYLGSMLALVPRAVLPSKPIPGSVDDTYFGTPPRLVAINVGYDPLTANVGVSPASVEIWHFGYLGLIPLVVINVLHWRLMNSFLSAPSFVVRVLAVYLVVVPAFIGFFNSGDIIIMNEERVLALYVLLSIAPYLLYRPGRRIVRRAEPEPQTA